MNVAYLVAAALAVTGALVHGVAGEAALLRKLDAGVLPRTRWGGGRSSLGLIRASWHMLTVTFAAFGVALGVCGAREDSLACAGTGTLVAATCGIFAVMAVAGPLVARRPAALIRHPAPALLSAVAVLAWLGTRS